MASPRSILRVVGHETIGPSTRALDVVRTDGAPWANVRGKYIILDTGLVLPDGKAVKRAYSLTPVDGDDSRCRLLVKRIDAGPGSAALHEANVGAEFTFSGPWGKLVPAEGSDEVVLFVATDTGITSALGMATRGHRERLTVLWLRSEDESFHDLPRVQEAIEGSGARFIPVTIPPINSVHRAEAAFRHVDALVAELSPTTVLAAGDGHLVFPLKERAFPAPHAPEVRIECFFHNPERKST